MRKLADMTHDEISSYLTMLGQTTKTVIVPDATFCLVLFGPDMKAHYTSNCRRLEMPDALEELARELRKSMASGN